MWSLILRHYLLSSCYWVISHVFIINTDVNVLFNKCVYIKTFERNIIVIFYVTKWVCVCQVKKCYYIFLFPQNNFSLTIINWSSFKSTENNFFTWLTTTKLQKNVVIKRKRGHCRNKMRSSNIVQVTIIDRWPRILRRPTSDQYLYNYWSFQ